MPSCGRCLRYAVSEANGGGVLNDTGCEVDVGRIEAGRLRVDGGVDCTSIASTADAGLTDALSDACGADSMVTIVSMFGCGVVVVVLVVFGRLSEDGKIVELRCSKVRRLRVGADAAVDDAVLCVSLMVVHVDGVVVDDGNDCCRIVDDEAVLRTLAVRGRANGERCVVASLCGRGRRSSLVVVVVVVVCPSLSVLNGSISSSVSA